MRRTAFFACYPVAVGWRWEEFSPRIDTDFHGLAAGLLGYAVQFSRQFFLKKIE